MKKVKITILQTTFNKELAEVYGADGLGPCPMMKEGQVFYADYAKPDGFCDEAWKAVYQCESRVEQELGKSGGNAAKDMTKQARQGADQGGGLDVS